MVTASFRHFAVVLGQMQNIEIGQRFAQQRCGVHVLGLGWAARSITKLLWSIALQDDKTPVIPETIDAIRALTGIESDPAASIARTNAALVIGTWLEKAGLRANA